MLKYNDFYWMNKAYKLALRAKLKGEIPISSVLVYNNKIISKSYNKCINNYNSISHSEIIVLKNGFDILKKFYLLNTTIYVTLEPCIMCIGAIMNSRVKRLVYASSCNKLGSVNFLMNILGNLGVDHKLKITSGVLMNKCSKLLKNFFKNKRF